MLDVFLTISIGYIGGLVLYKDGSPVSFIGDADGSRSRMTIGGGAAEGASDRTTHSVTARFLEAAGDVTPTTYSVRLLNSAGITQTAFVNRARDGSDAVRNVVAASSLIITEVAL
jgi:hypothetical protein